MTPMRLLPIFALVLLLVVLAAPGEAQAADQLRFKSVKGEWTVTSGVADNDIGKVLARGVPKRYIRYSMEGADGFSIGRRSGRVSYDGTPISGEQVSLTVTARDKNGEAESASRIIEVSVTQPEPEPPPGEGEQESAPQQEAANVAPSFDDGVTASRSVAENTPAGRDIGAALGVTDPDSGDTPTYTLTGADASSFAIAAVTGGAQLRTRAALDYENPADANKDNIYNVTVNVSDGKASDGSDDASVDDSIDVAVTVTDEDERMGPQGRHVVPSNWALIPRDASGQPLFGPGRSFRLVFLTSGKRDAQSSDIDDYNRFVQSHAAKNSHLQPFSGSVRALASTGSIYSATKNADTNGMRLPVYWLGGQRASWNQQNLFSSVWLAPCHVWDENGSRIADDDALAWIEGLGPEGPGETGRVGDASDRGAANCYPFTVLNSDTDYRPTDELHRLYGLSPIFTVETAPVRLKLTPRIIGENGGASRITATLTTARDSDVTVRVSAIPVSPAVAADFTLSGSADLIIRAGKTESENALTLTAVNNDVDADAKYVSVSGALTPAVSGLQDPTGARLTILDDEVPGPPGRTIPADSPLIPTDSQGDPLFSSGQSFRLLFITGRAPSQARNYTKSATEQEIAWYDAEVQTDVAESGVTAMRQYSGDFRSLVCTTAVDARDNTQTTYTQDNKGVPIYWLKGSKVADDYADLYGSDGWESFEKRNYNGVEQTWTVVTGCNSDGTAHESKYVGMRNMTYGTSAREPLVSRWSASRLQAVAFYGLSPVFTVE